MGRLRFSRAWPVFCLKTGMVTAIATERSFAAVMVFGLLVSGLGLCLTVIGVPPAGAVELHPELRLAPMGPPDADIRRRPEEPRNITARTRPRPELAALGVRIRSFLLLPALELGAGYNDNVRATEDNTRSDVYGTVSPRIEARSDWSRHAVRLAANGKQGRYRDTTSENYDDWRVTGGGRLDFGRASTVFGQASVSEQHEDRASPDSIDETEPSQFRVTETDLGWTHPFGRFDLLFAANVADYSFDDVDTTGLAPGTSAGRDRDRESRRVQARLGYTVWPGYGVYVQTAYNSQDYDHLSAGGLDRDSTGYEANAGIDLEVTDLIGGEAFIGYYNQSYEADGFSDHGGLGFGSNLYWNITTLSTVRFELERSVSESTQPGASGYLSTLTGLELEHELLRNLLLFAGTRYIVRDYQELDREENLWQHHVGATYMLNRHLYLRLRAVHRAQEATDGGSDFNQTFVEQSVVLQY
jgi:hypothetical protein